MPTLIDLSGEEFGHLRVICRSKEKTSRVHWKCRCVCGAITHVAGNNLQAGKQTSCGCMSGHTSVHGHAKRGQVTREYRTWTMMMQRCYNENYPRYADWGGRGITGCKRWHIFENFLADMGARPIGKTLDRINNDKGYSPKNCQWATDKEQSNNRRKRS